MSHAWMTFEFGSGWNQRRGIVSSKASRRFSRSTSVMSDVGLNDLDEEAELAALFAFCRPTLRLPSEACCGRVACSLETDELVLMLLFVGWALRDLDLGETGGGNPRGRTAATGGV